MKWTEKIKGTDVFWRKAVVAAALFVLAVPLCILVVRNLQSNMSNFEAGQFAQNLNLPNVEQDAFFNQLQEELEGLNALIEQPASSTMATTTATSTVTSTK